MWGYFILCFINVGIGLRVFFMFYFFVLIFLGYMKGIIDIIIKLGIVVWGFYGEGSEVVGNLY